MYQIKKRNGELEIFDLSKIKNAISKAFESIDRSYQESIIEKLSIKAVANAEKKVKDSILCVEDIQDSVESILMGYGYDDVSKAYILYRKQHERNRKAKEAVLDYKKTVDGYLKADDWRVKENASIDYSLGGLILGNSGAITANYWLSEVYDDEIASAHRNCDIHIHDLSMLSAYCNGGSLRQLIKEGLGGVPKKISSKPASHLSTLCNQIVNFLGILSLEFAGAQALSSVDTLLAPFVKSDSLSYNEVKQCIQSLVFGLNTPSRWGGQPVFSNFTIDWTVPDDLAELNCVVGGKEVDFKYKDCKREMDMINKAILEVMIDGDADGRSFSYPILTYSITKDFDWDEESINNKLLFEMTSKYGIPYFSNYINSDMSPSDSRAMCPIHKDEKVCIRDGIVAFIDTLENIYNNFNGKDIEVPTICGWKRCRAIKLPSTKVYKITLSNGLSIRLGENHIQPTKSGTKLTKSLLIGDDIPFVNSEFVHDFSIDHKDDKFYVKYSDIVSIEELEYDDDLYCFEVDNDDHLFIMANGIITHNCRLRLDLRELRRKNGGYFGSGDGTGSIGVTTINMPRLAYLSKDEDDFYKRLDNLMDICSRSLEIKRNVVSKLLQNGLYPYTKRYVKNFNNHFSTIATNGMNEMCLNANWIKDNIASEKGYKFAKDVLDHMRNRLSDYQEMTGNLYNLESAPAESVCLRFAMHDKRDFPDIITAGDNTDGSPYYTNSSNLPVGYTDDVFEALDHQDELQTKYTGGTVFHVFLGEKLPSWQSAMKLTKKIAENYKLPYFTFSPTYSVCQDHGYIAGEHWKCPHCGKETEVYSRVTGYYRAVQNFNDGKAHEFKDRKEYKITQNQYSMSDKKEVASESIQSAKNIGQTFTLPILVTTETCPNCKIVKKYIEESGFKCSIIVASENKEFVQSLGIEQAPTLVVFDENNNATLIANTSNIRKYLEDHTD